ncbi:MAG: hypothetical protein GY816_20135 [Cytophagales bacterium]|nr:hypothetical protein [Cytophagales bacterium]
MKEQSPDKFYTKKVQKEIDDETISPKDLLDINKLISDSKQQAEGEKSDRIIVTK